MSDHQFLDPTRDKVGGGLCALAIMTKAPEAGRVKTRLSPPLSPEQAAELNRRFLKDLAASLEVASSQTAAAGVAVYTPIGKEDLYRGVIPSGFYFVPQRGNGFGERLVFAAEDLLRLGFNSFCLINSDSPTVPATSFAQAARELVRDGDRLVLGPSDDGGYYLIGLKRMHRRLFEEIDWSTEHVLEQTRERAAELRLETVMLPTAFDIDDNASLKRLWSDIADVPETPARATRAYLKSIFPNAIKP